MDEPVLKVGDKVVVHSGFHGKRVRVHEVVAVHKQYFVVVDGQHTMQFNLKGMRSNYFRLRGESYTTWPPHAEIFVPEKHYAPVRVSRLIEFGEMLNIKLATMTQWGKQTPAVLDLLERLEAAYNEGQQPNSLEPKP